MSQWEHLRCKQWDFSTCACVCVLYCLYTSCLRTPPSQSEYSVRQIKNVPLGGGSILEGFHCSSQTSSVHWRRVRHCYVSICVTVYVYPHLLFVGDVWSGYLSMKAYLAYHISLSFFTREYTELTRTVMFSPLKILLS